MQKSARPRINRRQFLASAALTSAGLASVSPRADTRPNILVITTDQQWAGALSCAGNPHVKTPNMDRLAASGVRFDAAYTANPICVPSRTRYMTGTPSHVNGVVTNMRANQVPVDVPCLSKHFRDQGGKRSPQIHEAHDRLGKSEMNWVEYRISKKKCVHSPAWFAWP